MKIENYIAQLLYRYQCVTVPGFGAFLTEIQSAQLNESTNSFFPPKKMISFNSHLKNNDGLLANHIAQAEKTSYGFAVSAIAFEVLSWRKTLEENGVISLKNIGDLRFNADQNIIFTPSDQTNFLTSSFGLSPFVSPLVKKEIFEKKIEETIENDAISLYENEEGRSSNPFLKYAAILVLGLGITGSIGYPLYQNNIATKTLIVESAVQKKVQNKIQEATFFIENPLPAVTLSVDSAKVEVVAEKALSYHIMAGAFRSEKNARKAYNQLIKDGYSARMLGENKHGLFPVLYGSYATMAEAEKAQREIHKGENPQAWILVETL
ncbi:HU domain-containing protein [Flavobacterium hibernum]|uniref:SPOR domain-containing protein n=1 Tax=Flavobacterium hibernum TaxID=37752 RepID=A0A0D0EDJ3_9FLAO|nr:SPOR domain-containing protein [Flavobacterium hibernum]KIO50704.1 sporulation protein [Flavobacterium hibernum]OXA87573.1 SPOR domain-containing protein [Flavobacterium hibernum]STO14447.1 Sporulation related domain [Flavobacterium hibernum]